MRKIATSLVLFLSLAACQSQSAAPADPQAFLDLQIRNASTPMDGVYCSGQPTEEQFAKLKDAGVRKVVHLRAANEDGTGWEEAKAKELGIEFVRIPVAGAEAITVDNAQKLASELATVDGPVLVSCGSSNRVGALFAVKAHFLDGKSTEESLQIGKDCGMTRLEATVTELLNKN